VIDAMGKQGPCKARGHGGKGGGGQGIRQGQLTKAVAVSGERVFVGDSGMRGVGIAYSSSTGAEVVGDDSTRL